MKTQGKPKQNHFHEELIKLYHTMIRDCGHRAAKLLSLIDELGAVGAVAKIVGKNLPSLTFVKLYNKHRIDLTLEAFILRDEFRVLFTVDIIKKCMNRLENVHFPETSHS